jgi:tripartite-type tricarboxylate transporter receptor subunit TctC
VARARPDGLTLLATSAMTHAANPALYERLPYHPIRNFAAITPFSRAVPFVLIANKGLGAATLADLVAVLKARPGRYDYGWGSVPSRVASEIFRMQAGVDVVHVGYRGNQQAFPDLVKGRIAMMSVDVTGAKPLVDRGEVDALALSDAARHPSLPACRPARRPACRASASPPGTASTRRPQRPRRSSRRSRATSRRRSKSRSCAPGWTP